MRSDMHELLVERPRKGSHWRNYEVRAQRAALVVARARGVWEDLPASRGGAPQQGPRKHLNENLAPLCRFLSSNCGRPWDKVFGELRRSLDMRSAIQAHIMQHLWDFVAVDVERRDDGRWIRTTGWRQGMPVRTDGKHFYIDPHTGLLMRPKCPKPQVIRPPADRHVDADGRVYVRRNDIWWAVELATLPWVLPTGARQNELFDVVLKAVAGSANRDERLALYGDARSYAVRRRQLSRREIKALGLWRRG